MISSMSGGLLYVLETAFLIGLRRFKEKPFRKPVNKVAAKSKFGKFSSTRSCSNKENLYGDEIVEGGPSLERVIDTSKSFLDNKRRGCGG
jgi:hypothetical protein